MLARCANKLVEFSDFADLLLVGAKPQRTKIRLAGPSLAVRFETRKKTKANCGLASDLGCALQVGTALFDWNVNVARRISRGASLRFL